MNKKHELKIEIGKAPGSELCPLFLFSVRLCPPIGQGGCFILGRLYSGYVGLLWTVRGWVDITIWFYKPERPSTF